MAILFFVFILNQIKMINCKIYKDISVATSGENGCMIVDVNVGIQDGLYVFNLEDIQGLIFENDSRPDSSLFVDTIITNQPFYRIDATNINYQEEYNDHYYHETLTADIISVRNEIEEIMEAAVHGKYVIAFKVVGNEHYKLVGWKEGLSLDDVLTISSEDNSFELTFEGNTTFPMLEADKSNFDLKNKVFDPIFEPLFEVGKVICSDGWATAMYVVKVNAAGQALDKDDKLCQYSGLPQAAYKLEGVADGDYYIIGTYSANEMIDGRSVRIFDTTICNVSGSITVNPSTVNLNSTNSTTAITVVSSSDWELVTYPSFVDISRTGGGVNDQLVYIYGTETCGTEILTFRNRLTKQTATLTVHNDRIGIGDAYTYPNATTNFTLTPIVCGDYTATSSVGSVTINDDGSFTVTGIPTSNNEQTITVTLTSGTETKTITITILGNDVTPHRRALAEWCQTD